MVTEKLFLSWKEQGYNWLPVITELWGDLETPLSLYLKLANQADTYLLETGFDGEHPGRYSYIGFNNHSKITVKNHYFCLMKSDCIIEEQVEDPLARIEQVVADFIVPPLEYDFVIGGLIGYFGYDTIRYIEPKLTHHCLKDPLNVPDIVLYVPEQLIVYDHLTGKIYIIVYVTSDDLKNYQRALESIRSIKDKIIGNKATFDIVTTSQNDAEFTSNFAQEAYEQNVDKARDFFLAGDAMQLILSQRFKKSFHLPPLLLYRSLRCLNPSPYMYYFNLGDFYIVGASPETLVHSYNRQVTVKPLAGTRPRGANFKDDEALAEELLNDTKENAEHLMLIDLGRNDIGKVCQIGSVRLTKKMVIERFSHVMHISSTVTGLQKPTIKFMDILKATFPAGTVSGAPKIHAMELIDTLEVEQRGIYAGCIGYVDWYGNIDMAITLRTAVIKDETLYVQTGAGIVADSNPTNEWQECLNKAKALFLATELAEKTAEQNT